MEFTENELYWMDVISKGEKTVEDLIDKKDIWITEKFIEFLKLMIKYENLRTDPELIVPHKRVVRIHKNIPTFYLEYYKYEYMIFNGLYIVTDVVFLSKSMLDPYLKNRKNQTKSKLKELGVPDCTLYNIPREVMLGNHTYYACLCKNLLTEGYVRFQSNWSYPTFSKEGV